MSKINVYVMKNVLLAFWLSFKIHPNYGNNFKLEVGLREKELAYIKKNIDISCDIEISYQKLSCKRLFFSGLSL